MIKEKVRIVTFLTRQQIDYLDKIGKDALFSYGRKLSRVQIISELVNLLMQLGINIKGIDLTQDGLASCILKTIHNHNATEEDRKNA